MPTATLTSKGQTTIPHEVRERLKLKTGDKLEFLIRDNGEVVLRPVTRDIMDLYAILHRKGRKPVSIDEMKEAIRRRFSAR